ncbi:zinc finger protein 391 [Galendromus occidentalis]|uniref:Zinc finger protein 391 n=1 Tax=Galendromus occidentalis TaxID=34638 RepID=A0AAJ6QRD4_9ACAR|nr:zinc finger protein 391 [Galendromus occidentalis]
MANNMQPGGSGLRQVVNFVEEAYVDDGTYSEYTDMSCEYAPASGTVIQTLSPVKIAQGTTRPLILRVVKEVSGAGEKEETQEVVLKPVSQGFEGTCSPENDEEEVEEGLNEEDARKEASKISQELLSGLVVYYVRPNRVQESTEEESEVVIGGESIEPEPVSTAVGAEITEEDNGTDEKKTKYVCHICKLQFDAGTEHRYHMRTFHNATAARPCPTCSKPFYNTTDLRNHVMAHRGVKPYRCHICGHAFTVKSNLTNHMLRHGPLDFECQVCGKRLAQPASLRKHLRSHGGNKPFPCNLCGKRFLQKGDLTRHQLVHNGQRDFQCDLCEKQFSLKANLQTHRRKIHGHDTQ